MFGLLGRPRGGEGEEPEGACNKAAGRDDLHLLTTCIRACLICHRVKLRSTMWLTADQPAISGGNWTRRMGAADHKSGPDPSASSIGLDNVIELPMAIR